MMLCIDGLFIISSIPHELNERLWLNGYLAFDKISRICLCDIFMYMWLHLPMVMCIVSTIYIIFECWFISSLVKSVFERSLSGKKSQFLSKSGFCCYLGIYLYNLGTFWVLTIFIWPWPVGGFITFICVEKRRRSFSLVKSYNSW